MEFNRAGQSVVTGCAGHGQTRVLASLLACYWPFAPFSLHFHTLFPPLSTLISPFSQLWSFLWTARMSCTMTRCSSRHPIRSPTPLQAVTPPICRVVQRAAPVDPPGGWHSWATGQTACCASLARRRVRGPLALVGLPGSLPRSVFSPPLR